jgi:alginate O-acetyltransferase complex protein AlgI
LALLLHLGLLHGVSLAWRLAGVAAAPIMNRPLWATSLADFLGRRWNVAFRDAAHQCVFRPLARRWGPAAATLAVFVVSGLIHEVVISLPVPAAAGRPTLYFLLQAAAASLERSRAGSALGLGRGWLGRLFAAVVIVAPVGLLFPPAFLEQAVLPMVAAAAAG